MLDNRVLNHFLVVGEYDSFSNDIWTHEVGKSYQVII